MGLGGKNEFDLFILLIHSHCLIDERPREIERPGLLLVGDSCLLLITGRNSVEKCIIGFHTGSGSSFPETIVM